MSYQDVSAELTLYAVGGQGPSLLGRDWIRPDWKGIFGRLPCLHGNHTSLARDYRHTQPVSGTIGTCFQG